VFGLFVGDEELYRQGFNGGEPLLSGGSFGSGPGTLQTSTLPVAFILILIAFIVVYLGLIEIVKNWFFKRTGRVPTASVRRA